MTPILYDKTEQSFTTLGLGVLNEAISCVVKTVLNGAFELEMQYPVKGRRYADLRLGNIIKAVAQKNGTAQLFDINSISKPLNGIVTVYATHVTGRKAFIPVMPCTATSASEVFDVIDDNVAETNPFTFWTDKNTIANFRLTAPASLGQVLGGMEGSVLDTYHGEYEFDNFTIKFWNHRGQDNGVTLRYGKNITDILQEESIAATITGICPFWSDADGHVVVLPEKTVDSLNAANFAFKRTVVIDFSTEFETQPTVSQLRSAAEAYVSRSGIGIPQVSISLSYENLADYEEYKDKALLEQVRLGDTVHVFFEPLDITAEARVASTLYDTLADKYRKVEIGSVRADLSGVLKGLSDDANQNAQDLSSVTKNTLESAFEKALEALSGADGGNIVIRTNQVTGKPYEILIMDTDDINTAVNVLRLNMNGLGLSTNGINGPYTAAITGGGIVANAITTGVLNAGRIQAGILQSQEDPNDPSFYLNLDTGVLKGKFSELSITGQTVDQIAEGVLDDWVDNDYAADIADLQSQIDGQIETWFDNYVPTLNNAPANTWTTTAQKDNHIGDLFYVVDNAQHGGECYRFVYYNGAYSWELVQDSGVANAIAQAQAAAALAGTKKRVFVTQPVPPYDVGDLWVQGSTGDIVVCITARASGSYVAADWALASKYISQDAITNYDLSLNQAAIFNKLTNNGITQGIYLYNNKVYINADYISSGVLQGIKIIADEGFIGGWKIDNSHLFKDTEIDGVKYSPRIYAPPTPTLANRAFSVQVTDANDDITYPFSVTYGGHLHAEDADIAGEITAESGAIGGWVISGTGIYKAVPASSGISYRVLIDAPSPVTSADYAIAVKKTQGGVDTYPFALTYGGKLIANDAEISGTFNATTGTIGGWTIDSNRLYKETTIDGVYYSPRISAPASPGANNGAFIIRREENGTTTYPFIVYYDGSMVATKATVTGRIVAESGIIGNGATNKINIGTNPDNASIYSGVTSFGDTAHNGFYIGTDGLVLGKGKFKVTPAGALTATGVNVSGAIYASSGTIGTGATRQITISANASNAAIYYGMSTLDDTLNNGFYLGTNGLSMGKGAFKVTSSGVLVATSATISGSVTATSGVIGGWTIGANSITKDTEIDGNAYRVNIQAPNTPGAGNRAFFVRKTEDGTNTYPFAVFYDGKVVATNAEISGKITASEGTIGGFTIDSTAIRFGALTSTSLGAVALTSAGFTRRINNVERQNLRLAIGSKFGVNNSGVLYATDAVLKGTLESSNATITGGTIDISTSSSTNDSIKLSYSDWVTSLEPLNLIAWNKSTKKEIKIQAGGIFFYKGMNSINDIGTRLSSISGDGIWLIDDNEITRVTLTGSGLTLKDADNTTRVSVNGGGVQINDSNGAVKTWLHHSNGNGVLYLYDTASRLRANLNDGGLYFYLDTSTPFTLYGQHAINFMPPTAEIDAGSYNTGGWIDFHYQRSSSATSRLIGAANTTTAIPSITNGSDRRLKENVRELTDSKFTDFLNGLKPVEYNYKRYAGTHYGFVAQDVIEVAKRLNVDTSGLIESSALYAPEDDTEYMMLNYIDLIAVLVKGYQDLYAKICALEARFQI